ncbi:hypothetical protein HMPREF0401_00684 [Fusobacterium animalis 11_3_2]|uniref:Uncharacterized protein n=1 Tax=Fusobacterium animalis 11_3_2 TaxID=457403 RepID=F7KYL3_9FUSO|nr:hypothetical protein [Fusobacterium animalis]EGN63323.1 hypothetical protein HMPREF0401_00684 [Fusobacterium animalis 11_3_2]
MSELTYGRELIYANDIDYYDLKLPKQYYGANVIARALSGVIGKDDIDIKGLENLTIEELELFRDEILIKAHRLMEDNTMDNIKECTISPNIKVDNYDMEKFYNLTISYQAGKNVDWSGREKRNVFYIPIFKEMWKDMLGNLKCKLQDWVYSFGFEFKERGWFDERYITFVKLMDIVNIEIKRRIINEKDNIASEVKKESKTKSETKKEKTKLTLEKKQFIALNKILNYSKSDVGENINANFTDDDLLKYLLNSESKILKKAVSRSPKGAKEVVDYIDEFYKTDNEKAEIIGSLNLDTPQEIFNFVLAIDGYVGEKLCINTAYTDNTNLDMLKEEYQKSKNFNKVERLIMSDVDITTDIVLNGKHLGNIFIAVNSEEKIRCMLENVYRERIGKLLAENMSYITGKDNNLDEEGKVEKEHFEHFVENDVKDVGMEM